ncbi:hypothetical protein BW723_14125 [Polaribacter reichenbachii]|uniref:Protein NO VEIN C-terminal domain-containing protein n=1 Tax=Polaribacter reichenbachii TaxID=996801 RepID=A0A1B8U1D6_9FLAO|nr:DUF3883 domain-containing protein [Polaribacter reichenbachii]APZ47348.1 hypothetical protein BW723_14125 [Polaribacter reichenbachii]AUC17989.1 hypothetical protein BTO17_04580 [Polaribacter reichenbachii]OBY65684.1 hypothetical protein LPB301_07655 [Polaribacter reichenbachii]
MLKDLRKFDNLGTPNFFFELLTTLKDSEKQKWRIGDINQLFFNRVIDNHSVFEGCILLAFRINLIIEVNGNIELDQKFENYLNSKNQMNDKFVERLFLSLESVNEIYEIFSSENFSQDIVYQSLQLKSSAFGFKYSNLKQLLIDFNVLKVHPTNEINNLIINTRYKKIFDKVILPQIKKRKIGIEEFKKLMEQQQIYGEEAEKFVLKYEHNRLNGVKEIQWIAEYIVNAGYDIASFNTVQDEKPTRFIEVKSYEGESPYFFWSRNEMEVAKRKLTEYWLYLINRKKINQEDYEPLCIQNPSVEILKNAQWDKSIDKYKIMFNG